jgi:hypothetical protein
MYNSYPETVDLVIVRVDNRLGLFTQEDYGLREHWHTQYRPSNIGNNRYKKETDAKDKNIVEKDHYNTKRTKYYLPLFTYFIFLKCGRSTMCSILPSYHIITKMRSMARISPCHPLTSLTVKKNMKSSK